MKKPVSALSTYPTPVLRVAFRNFIEQPTAASPRLQATEGQQSLATKRLKTTAPQLPYYYQHHIRPKRYDFF